MQPDIIGTFFEASESPTHRKNPTEKEARWVCYKLREKKNPDAMKKIWLF